jgi:hypothetical protein
LDLLTIAQVRELTIDRIQTMSSRELIETRDRIPPEAWKSYPERQAPILLELEARARMAGWSPRLLQD